MRKSFYFFDNLKSSLPLEYLDSIKFELDNKIYYYGDQFLNNKEKKGVKKISDYFRSKAVDIYRFIRDMKFSLNAHKKYAVSGAYFGLDQYLEIQTAPLPWTGMQICKWKQYRTLRKYQRFLRDCDFLELLSNKAVLKYEEVMGVLREIYSNESIKFLCLPQDMSPFEKMSIKTFKELGKKSFVFLHGLPGRYNNIDDNRTDFLVVWGEKIKEHYIQKGLNPNKIFISGHPRYGTYDCRNLDLKNSLDNILIITKSMNGGQHSDVVRLTDRGNLIVFLRKIEAVLTKLGVTSVTFRPHPSESADWYYRYIDKNFFKRDIRNNIKDSLNEASLVIGPTSSVFLDSLMNGVNYLVFEPSIDGLDLTNFPLVPPFDGSDKRVVIARDEDELLDNITSKRQTDITILEDYIQKNFDLTFMNNLDN